MQKPKVIDGATAGLEFQDSSTEAALDGTIVRAGFQNDNFGNLYDVIEKAGYTLIDDDLSQIHKALRGLYVDTYTYNTSTISTQTVNDVVLGSDGVLYKAQADAITGDDPVGSVTGDWAVFSGNNVLLNTNQTIAGIKTFSSFPITPSSAPTTDYQATNKKYVDDKSAGVLTGFKNILINGGFNISQRGDFTTATAVVHNEYMIDRWKNYLVTAAANLEDLVGSIKMIATGSSSANGTMSMDQFIEDLNVPVGQEVTFSAKVTSNHSGTKLYVYDNGTPYSSLSHTGGGAEETLSVTFTPSSNTDLRATVGIGRENADATISIDDYFIVKKAQLEIGSLITNFEQRPAGLELDLCQRYYQQMIVQGQTYSSATATWFGNYPVPMRDVPTITGPSTFDLEGSGQVNGTLSTTETTEVGCRIVYTGTGYSVPYAWRSNTSPFELDAEL